MSKVASSESTHLSFSERVDRLLCIHFDTPAAITAIDHENLADEIVSLLGDPAFTVQPVRLQAAVLAHTHALYSGSWHTSGQRIIPSAERTLARMLIERDLNLDAICIAYDLLYFLYWCWNVSIDQQTSFADQVVRPFAKAIRSKTWALNRRALRRRGPIKIGLLAQFVARWPGNELLEVDRNILRSLSRGRPNYEPILYAWMFHDDASIAEFEHLGVAIRRIQANSCSERIAALKKVISIDGPEVLITDMNSAVPTVLFEHRIAPVQIYHQCGMPFWPLENIDGVFRVWEFDPKRAGLARENCFQMNGPWRLTELAPIIDPARIDVERARFPVGRLIGTYGRLSKVTPEFLACVAEAIKDVPDVTVVLGGTGDSAPIRRAIDRLGIGDRFVIVDGYVDGQIWGHFLEIFLDTFPLQGGSSCRQMIAKGKPIVSLLSADMPNLVDERVRSLVGMLPADYTRILKRLLQDQAFYCQACDDTHAFARSRPSEADYDKVLFAAIEEVRSRRRSRRLTEVLTRPIYQLRQMMYRYF